MDASMLDFLVLTFALLVWFGRFTIPGHGPSWPGSYEAFAHIFVGALIVLACQAETRLVALPCLVILSLFELLMFLVR
jgi:hypothetical protein